MLQQAIAGVSQSRQEDDMDRVRHYYKAGEYRQALTALQPLKAKHPSAEAYLLSGSVHEAMGDNILALADYEAVLQLDRGHLMGRMQRGLMHLRIGNGGKAYDDFTYLIEHEPAETKYILFQIDPYEEKETRLSTLKEFRAGLYYYRAQASMHEENYKLALADYHQAIEMDSLADYFIGKGLCHLKMNGSSQALDNYRQALKIDPSSGSAWYHFLLLKPDTTLPTRMLDTEFIPMIALLGYQAHADEKYVEAHHFYEQAARARNPDPAVLLNKGRVAVKLGRMEVARDDFKKALDVAPEENDALYLLGNSYFHTQSYQSAISYYQQYLLKDAGHGPVWYNLAMCQLALGDQEAACHSLHMASLFAVKEAAGKLAKHCEDLER